MPTLIRFIAIIIFLFSFLTQNAFCAGNYRVKDVITDNSDRMVFIKGEGNFKTNQNIVAPTPIPTNSLNILNDISSFTITNPKRYVIDIPNATLAGSSRVYTYQNSSYLKNVQLAQFSANPNIVRIVFTLNENADITKFKTYTNGSDIVVKYTGNIIDNSIQYKFYTPSGDMDKSAVVQNTSAILTYNNSQETREIIPRLQTKYYLSQISQNSNGLILRGLGSISMQKANYSPDNTKATLILDNAAVSSKLENKTYNIPSTKKEIKATLTINKLNSKKVQLTLLGNGARDYRFVVAPDGQSLFVSHRSFIINTIFSQNPASASSYKITNAQNGYKIFDITFSRSVTYDVFELDNNFYLDVNNLGDFNTLLFEQAVKNSDIKIQALKISQDKTRFIIPLNTLNFSYANVESNSKSIKLCFKEKPANVAVANTTKNNIADKTDNKETKKEQEPVLNTKKAENINVNYIPKQEDMEQEKAKKRKENATISSMKKIVIDPGHGGSDCGAIGGGYYEKNLNLIVAKLVQEKLAKKNIFTYMTRKKDDTLSLEERVIFSNELNPDLYVSIHTNSTLQEDIYGLETHYYKDDSYELAKIIHSNFASEKNLKKWDTKDRGVIKSRFYVINHTEAPSILIEIGFISNLKERSKLLEKNRQEEIADAIVKGILEYLKTK